MLNAGARAVLNAGPGAALNGGQGRPITKGLVSCGKPSPFLEADRNPIIPFHASNARVRILPDVFNRRRTRGPSTSAIENIGENPYSRIGRMERDYRIPIRFQKGAWLAAAYKPLCYWSALAPV